MWQTNCGNGIAEIGEKKIVAMPLLKYGGKKNLWQSNCGNGIAEIGRKKKLWEPNCRNAIAEIGE